MVAEKWKYIYPVNILFIKDTSVLELEKGLHKL
jgi:hypothetical protein